jgi:hypothetical protein
MLTSKIARAHEKAGRRPIAIYPELYTSNDLNCDRVIRYLLNKPGVFSDANPDVTKAFWQSPFRKSEFHIHFAEEFRLPHLNSVPLYTPNVNENVFFEVTGAKRDGFLVYSYRREVHDAMIPDWARPYILVSMASPRSPQELAYLYRRSRGLIVFERTGARMEAACAAVQQSQFLAKAFRKCRCSTSMEKLVTAGAPMWSSYIGHNKRSPPYSALIERRRGPIPRASPRWSKPHYDSSQIAPRRFRDILNVID